MGKKCGHIQVLPYLRKGEAVIHIHVGTPGVVPLEPGFCGTQAVTNVCSGSPGWFRLAQDSGLPPQPLKM